MFCSNFNVFTHSRYKTLTSQDMGVPERQRKIRKKSNSLSSSDILTQNKTSWPAFTRMRAMNFPETAKYFKEASKECTQNKDAEFTFIPNKYSDKTVLVYEISETSKGRSATSHSGPNINCSPVPKSVRRNSSIQTPDSRLTFSKTWAYAQLGTPLRKTTVPAANRNQPSSLQPLKLQAHLKGTKKDWRHKKRLQRQIAAIRLDSVVPIFEIQLHSSVTNSGNSAWLLSDKSHQFSLIIS